MFSFKMITLVTSDFHEVKISREESIHSLKLRFMKSDKNHIDVREREFSIIASFLNYMSISPELTIKRDHKRQVLLASHMKRYPFEKVYDEHLFEVDGKSLRKFTNTETDNEFLEMLNVSGDRFQALLDAAVYLEIPRLVFLLHDYYEKEKNTPKFNDFKNYLSRNPKERLIFITRTFTFASFDEENFYKNAISKAMETKKEMFFLDIFTNENRDEWDNECIFQIFDNLRDNCYFKSLSGDSPDGANWDSYSLPELFRRSKNVPLNDFVGFFILCARTNRIFDDWNETVWSLFKESLNKNSPFIKKFIEIFSHILSKKGVTFTV